MTDSNGKLTIASAFAHLDHRQVLAEGITGGFNRIGMKGKVWTLNRQGETYRFVREDDGSPLGYLDVVFVGINPATSKMYYADNYSEDSGGNAPICAALDGKVPDPGVPIRQAETCAVCKHNEWLPNRGGKECQDHKRAAVLLLPYMKTKPAMESPLLEPVFLKIPPASLKSLKSYSDSLEHRGAHFASVITRITFAPDRQFQMNFDVKQPLTNAEAPLVLPLLEDPQTKMLVGGTAQIYELNPDPMARVERRDTGLTAAFAKPAAASPGNVVPASKGRGRPRREEPVQEAVPEPVTEDAQEVTAGSTWEESDRELDEDMSKLMGKKLSDMLK